MHFLLDEMAPDDLAQTIRALGHEATFVRDILPAGSKDPVVATVAEQMGAILVSWDGDFQKIAPRIPQGMRARFRKLSRIWMRCLEPRSPARIASTMSFIIAEYDLKDNNRDKRIILQIGDSFIRSDR